MRKPLGCPGSLTVRVVAEEWGYSWKMFELFGTNDPQVVKFDIVRMGLCEDGKARKVFVTQWSCLVLFCNSVVVIFLYKWAQLDYFGKLLLMSLFFQKSHASLQSLWLEPCVSLLAHGVSHWLHRLLLGQPFKPHSADDLPAILSPGPLSLTGSSWLWQPCQQSSINNVDKLQTLFESPVFTPPGGVGWGASHFVPLQTLAHLSPAREEAEEDMITEPTAAASRAPEQKWEPPPPPLVISVLCVYCYSLISFFETASVSFMCHNLQCKLLRGCRLFGTCQSFRGRVWKWEQTQKCSKWFLLLDQSHDNSLFCFIKAGYCLTFRMKKRLHSIAALSNLG